MKIAFLTSLNTGDERLRKASWSGTYHYMAEALQKYCGDVCYLGPVESKIEMGLKIYNRMMQVLARRRYSCRHSILLAKRYGKVFSKNIARGSFDLIFAPAAAIEIAFLRTIIPIVYSSDTTFRLLQDYYPEYSNLLGRSIREGNTVEKMAIQKSSLIIYPTAWAAQSACEDYCADKKKIHVIPYGANLNKVPPREVALRRKKSKYCRMLFLGVDWKRKGGALAFETLLRLEDHGIYGELVVCGCVPPKEFSHKRMKVIPFLDKSDRRQQEELEQLFLTSDFFLLPTRNECYGIVFCEANAFGLPVITTDTGGVSGVIENGKNGFLLPLSASGKEYARKIYEVYSDDDVYSRLIQTSRETYETRLNWEAWGEMVKEVFEEYFLR